MSQRLPALKLQSSSWLRFSRYSLLGKGQSGKDVLSASRWEPVILRDLNESCWFFLCWKISVECFITSFMSGYKYISPLVLHPAIVQRNDAENMCKALFDNECLLKAIQQNGLTF